MTIRARLLLTLLLVPAPAMLEIAGAEQVAAPPRRAHHSLIYDPVLRKVLLTGGSTPINEGQAFQFFNDVWAWDGTRWSRVGASGKELSGARLAYDSRRSRVVSFGGYADGLPLGDVRVLEGATCAMSVHIHRCSQQSQVSLSTAGAESSSRLADPAAVRALLARIALMTSPRAML